MAEELKSTKKKATEMTPPEFFETMQNNYNLLQMKYEAQADLVGELCKRLIYIEKKLDITYRTLDSND